MSVLKKWVLCMLLCAALAVPCAQAQTFAAAFCDTALLFDENGEIFCPPGLYARILPVTSGIFAAESDGGWLLLDENGEPLCEELYEDVYAQDGWLFLKKDGLYAAAGLDMTPVTQHLYTQIVPNGEGGFLAIKTEPMDDRGDGVYLIAPDGSETAAGTVIVYGLNAFSCGRSPAVGSGGKRTGYLAPDGTWAITAQYGYGAQFVPEGLAAASADSGVGVIDTDGNWVVSPKFEQIDLTEGNCIMAVRTESGRVGLMDINAREKIAEPEGKNGFARTRDLVDMALVTMDGVATLYAADGSVLNTWEESTGAALCSAGAENLILSMDGGEYLLSAQAQTVAGPYRRIDFLEEGLFSAQRPEGGCDLIDGAGNTVAETDFEKIHPAGSGVLTAQTDSALLLIRKDGSVIVELARNEAAQ